MTSGASNFLLNIVELQNTITSASGLSPVASLSNTVAQLQEMLIYDEKRLAVNTISKYSQSPIQVLDSMNFASNATLSVNGTALSGGSSAAFGQVSSIGYISSFTNYFSTTVATDTAIDFQVGSPPTYPLALLGNGTTRISGPLKITGAGTPTLGHYLTCMDTGGTAEWRVPGSVSDARWKTNIRPIEEASQILEGMRGVRFEWLTGGSDVGVIAQEVAAVLPEAVHGGDPFVVEYIKIIPVLIEVVKDLRVRVSTLEGLNTVHTS
jgi:hypothetical protein